MSHPPVSQNEFHYGRLNIMAGAICLILAGAGGMALGATFDQQAVKDGYHMLQLPRFFLRGGHTHLMAISLYNLIVGLLVDRWFTSGRVKRICSVSAFIGLSMPMFLALRGALGAPANFPPFGALGALALMVSFFLIVLAGVRPKS